MKRIFQFFKQIFDPPGLDTVDIREAVFQHCLVIACIFGSLAIILFLMMTYQNHELTAALIYLGFYIVLILLTIARKLPYITRVNLVLVLMYGFGIAELIRNGYSGDGRIMLLTLCGLAGLFLGRNAGLIGLGISLVTLTVFGIGMPMGWIPLPVMAHWMYSASFLDWQSGNLLFALLTTALIGSGLLLYRGLERSMDRQKQLTIELEKERSQLEHKIEKQTAHLRKEINDRKNAEQVLRFSEERFRSLFEAATIPIALIRHGRFILTNQACMRSLGLEDPEALIGTPFFDCLAEEERPRLEQEYEKYQRGDFTASKHETICVRVDGSRFYCEIASSTINLPDGKALLAFISDISERKEADQKLAYLSTHDSLTGLFNRVCYDQTLEAMRRGTDFPITVMLFDIDELKQVNDKYGHSMGDQLLKRAGQALTSSFRSHDFIARIGGDEFIALMYGTSGHESDQALARLEEWINLENESMGEAPELHLSGGSATAHSAEELEGAIQRADVSMYRNKKTRRKKP